MARYGDLERLEHHFDYCAMESRNTCDEWGAKCFEMARNATKNQPTADVAPRAEVAREIFTKLNYFINLYKKGDFYEKSLLEYIAEVEKVYTEEK